MAAVSSSTAYFEARSDEEHHVSPTIQSTASEQKKKRNLPRTPNPDAEVIALSPKTLMATNRFTCEVCNKGFRREQNLQLHRRGHNLPWKLKQRNNKQVKKKVYLCPEPSCVHHDPSHPLGDLTGIKKHYFRKHGEKKYKCSKCSKKYAVQSDWKAHSKTCGTREYRCDCSTLFSRRDSFITHRAFCDALAQESARHPHPSALGIMGSHLFGSHLSTSMNLGLSQVGSQISQVHDANHQSATNNMLNLGNANLEGVVFQSNETPLLFPRSQHRQIPYSSSRYFLLDQNQGLNQVFDYEQQRQQHGLMANKPNNHGLMHLPDLHSNDSRISSNLFKVGYLSGSSNPTNGLKSNENDSQSNDTNISPSSFMIPDHQFKNGGRNHDHIFLNSNNSHQESQMPPHMSATALLQKAAQMGSTTSNNNTTTLLKSFGSTSLQSQMESENQLQGLMNSPISGRASTMFGCCDLNRNTNMNSGHFNDSGKFNHQNISAKSNRTTLDFLGVGYLQREQQQHQQEPTCISICSSVPTTMQGNNMHGGS